MKGCRRGDVESRTELALTETEADPGGDAEAVGENGSGSGSDGDGRAGVCDDGGVGGASALLRGLR